MTSCVDYIVVLYKVEHGEGDDDNDDDKEYLENTYLSLALDVWM